MKKLFLGILFLTFACTTNPHKVREVDSDIDVKGKVGQSSIGLNKDGEVIVQEDSSAEDELRQVQWTNNKLEDDLKHQVFELKNCRKDLADERLGGDGSVTSIPEVDNLSSPQEMREQFGVGSKGDLKFVKREYYLDRLKRERDYTNKLKNSVKIVAKNRETCEARMASARVRHGLPSKRYKAQGYFTGKGAWVETRKAENSLDDAFQIKAIEASK